MIERECGLKYNTSMQYSIPGGTGNIKWNGSTSRQFFLGCVCMVVKRSFQLRHVHPSLCQSVCLHISARLSMHEFL